MKRPFESVRETFFDNLERVRENQRFNFSNSDKYMVWLVGFSIGGLSIIVTNLTEFNSSFNHATIKIILILLSISIIAGLFYRWAFYVYQAEYQNIEFYLQGAFSNEAMMETDPEDITEETNINNVVGRLQLDFGEDHSYILPIYNQSDDKNKNEILNSLKDHYKKTGDWAKRDFEFAIEYVKNTYKTAFGLSQKQIDKYFNSNSAKKLKLSGWIATIAFLLSCFSFITVIIILCCSYG